MQAVALTVMGSLAGVEIASLSKDWRIKLSDSKSLSGCLLGFGCVFCFLGKLSGLSHLHQRCFYTALLVRCGLSVNAN